MDNFNIRRWAILQTMSRPIPAIRGYFGAEQEERIAKKGIRRLLPTHWKTGEARKRDTGSGVVKMPTDPTTTQRYFVRQSLSVRLNANQFIWIFLINALLYISLLINGCGNSFSLGQPYGGPDLQECSSFLEQKFGITVWSQSSPFLVFELLLVPLLVNYIAYRLIWRRPADVNQFKSWLVFLLAVFAGLLAPVFLNSILR